MGNIQHHMQKELKSVCLVWFGLAWLYKSGSPGRSQSQRYKFGRLQLRDGN